MLQAAAQRGVKVNIIVYKEVTQALTRKYLTPILPRYLHSLLPRHTDPITSILSQLGLAATFASLEYVESENPLIAPIIPVSSSHTKHALENLHPNISVFRHPDHLPDAQTLQSSFVSSIQNMSLNAKTVAQLPGDALKAIYGMNDDVILYWAHHEKLCLIDGKTAFMGGLDLCYGRWDTNQHPIADCHPSNLDNVIFPGQDFNNARIMDFQDVDKWENNKLQRVDSSRMGWSDVSISLHGPVVEDLKLHFVERWNFIYNEKYDVRKDVRYSRLTVNQQTAGISPNYNSASLHGPASNQAYGPPSVTASGPGIESHNQLSHPVQPNLPYTPGSNYGHEQYPPPPPLPPTQSPGQNSYYPPPPPQVPPSTQSVDQNPYYPSPPALNQGQTQYYPPPPSSNPDQTQHFPPPPASNQDQGQTQFYPPPPTLAQGQIQYPPQGPRPNSSQGKYPTRAETSSRGIDDDFSNQGNERGPGFLASSSGKHHHLPRRLEEAGLGNKAEAIRDRFESHIQHMENRYSEHQSHDQGPHRGGGIPCQIVRSCSKWSHGVRTEHSIANAYINVIENSQHFLYIENQFFITASFDAQKPVKNKIGDAIVSRILKAARSGEKYKVIVLMPAIPAFAGDLKDDSSLGTRAIMEFQYNSINRGGYSIMETIGNAGFDPTQYIRFYNLRNYDRINVSASMRDVEHRSGVNYEDARREHDNAVELPGSESQRSVTTQNYEQYQQSAVTNPGNKGLGNGRWDSVSECYMLGGTDIRQVPWENGDFSEIDAFVSEELYVHSKVRNDESNQLCMLIRVLQVLIADDRVVICGSANLNDRSQLGYHDSEIAIVIEDPTTVESYMDGRPWRAAKFAATLRRQLFRKHLGLIPAQDMEHPDQNFEPIGVPNFYDFGSLEDQAVTDPLSDQFQGFWNSRARQNTIAFGKIFHPVPHDDVRNWKDYDLFYRQYFCKADKEAEGKEGKKKPAKYQWGHVVAENFSSGPQGVKEVKDLLSTIKGTIVEMPLLFLIEEDIAKEGVGFNAFTEEVYT